MNENEEDTGRAGTARAGRQSTLSNRRRCNRFHALRGETLESGRTVLRLNIASVRPSVQIAQIQDSSNELSLLAKWRRKRRREGGREEWMKERKEGPESV